MIVVDAVQSQFHLYLAQSSYFARNSHPKGTPMLGGSAVKWGADRRSLTFQVLFGSRFGLTRAICQASF
jgi:hypothetical protein